MTKMLVIGLDGATMDLIEPWAAEGKLPVLADLLQRGSYGRLQSVLPVLSSAAWTSFMTGMNPGKHGFYDFVKRAPDSYRLRPVHREQMRGQSLWKILSLDGRKVIVLNVPMTYPPEVVNGVMISGLGTPDYKTFTYPADLTQELLNRGYNVNSQVAFHSGDEQAYIDETDHITDQITETSLLMMQRQEWDFCMPVYRGPDEMAHFFWRFMDATHPQHPAGADPNFKNAVLNHYQKLDQAIGTLLEASGPDTNLIILSDHGTGAFYKGVLLNEWLRQKGWLVTKNGMGGSHRLFASIGLTRSNISATLRSMGLGRLERWIKDLLGDRIEILPVSSRAEFPNAIDWEHTKAYSFGYHGQIYINLKGREPQGAVSPGEEYDQVCREISRQLMELTDPADGKPVVDRVFHRSEAFHGPAYDEAPDLTVIMRGLSYITRSGYEFGKAGEIFIPPQEDQSGSHRMEGILIMAGPGVRPAGYQGNQSCIIDVAPTALHLMGLPIPDNMDGTVLEDWLSDAREVQLAQGDFESLNNPPSQEGMTEEQEAELIQRLKDLGYLE
jgi:predicted AlkP superfamily phosphohydrolase/phosphomutase